MTLTKLDLIAAVNSFKKENEKLNRRQKLYVGQKSDLYQLIVDDINSKKGKAIHHRHNKKSINSLPNYSAPLDFTNTKNTIPFLWECQMQPVQSSFIKSVGYNKQHRVLKLILNNTYVYFYHNVPESAFRTFLNTNSPGLYYNKFKNIFAGFRVV
jgi:hypothetical protein